MEPEKTKKLVVVIAGFICDETRHVVRQTRRGEHLNVLQSAEVFAAIERGEIPEAWHGFGPLYHSLDKDTFYRRSYARSIAMHSEKKTWSAFGVESQIQAPAQLPFLCWLEE